MEHRNFITTNSRLTLQNGKIWEKRLIWEKHAGTFRFHSFLFCTVLLLWCFDTMLSENRYYYFFFIILILFWMEPHFRRLYEVLFVRTWKGAILLSDIRQVEVLPQENELETKVVLHLASGRKKVYTFRTAENQVEKFVETIYPAGSLNVTPV